MLAQTVAGPPFDLLGLRKCMDHEMDDFVDFAVRCTGITEIGQHLRDQIPYGKIGTQKKAAGPEVRQPWSVSEANGERR